MPPSAQSLPRVVLCAASREGRRGVSLVTLTPHISQLINVNGGGRNAVILVREPDRPRCSTARSSPSSAT